MAGGRWPVPAAGHGAAGPGPGTAQPFAGILGAGRAAALVHGDAAPVGGLAAVIWPMYGQLGLSLTFHPDAGRVDVKARPLSVMYVRRCPRGPLNQLHIRSS